ncbi:hypothetical protein [Parasutterella muris]|nr:hypothetical protein [Parasutterella muris]
MTIIGEKDWVFGTQKADPNEQIPVLSIEPECHIKSKKEVIDRLSSCLSIGVINKDTGFLLQASRSDAKKTLFRKDISSPVVKAIFKSAQVIASSAVLIESHADVLHENEKVQAIHIFAVPTRVENTLYRVELTVRDYIEKEHERKMIHSIDGINIKEYEKASVWEPPVQEVASKSTLQKTGQPTNERYKDILNEETSSVSLGNLLQGYQRADGRNFFDKIPSEEFQPDGVYQSDVRQLYVNRFLFRSFIHEYGHLLEKNKFSLSERNRQLLFLNFEISADDFWISTKGLTTDKKSLEKIISNKASYPKLNPVARSVFEEASQAVDKGNFQSCLSENGQKILRLHIQALSKKYSKISDADAEIRSLYKRFSELEQAGKPLPQVPKLSKDRGSER